MLLRPCAALHYDGRGAFDALSMARGARDRMRGRMCVKFFSLFILWCILLVLSWPVALAVLILAPLLWIIALPLRLAAICVAAVLALLKSILFLPARVLGYRG